MGASTVWNIMKSLIDGKERLRLMYFHFLPFGMITLHSFTIDLVARCSFFGNVLLRGVEVAVGDESLHFAVIFISVHYDHEVAFVGLNDYGTSLFEFVSDLLQSLKFMVAILIAGWMLFILLVIQFLEFMCYLVFYTFLFVHR
jgi:hypothetical protein